MTFLRATIYFGISNLRLQLPRWLDMVFSIAMLFDQGSPGRAAGKMALTARASGRELALCSTHHVEQMFSQVIENTRKSLLSLDTRFVGQISAALVTSIPA